MTTGTGQERATTAGAPLGRHLLADLYDCAERLDDAVLIDTALRAAVGAARATLIDVRLHHFGPGQGVTGVALLAESHISIHSWPEHGYAALDFFLCGGANDADAALAVMVERLRPRQVVTHDHARGYGSVAADRLTSAAAAG